VGAKVASGVISETIDAADQLNSDSLVLVVDLFTLLNISKAGIKDLLVSNYGKLGIVQSLLDDLGEFLTEQKGQKSKGTMIMGKKDGQYFKQEVTEESVSEQVKEISDLLKWIDKNCLIIPHPKTLEIDSKIKSDFQTMLGKSFFDSIMASCNDGHILFSDDLILRRIAESDEFKTKTTWSQPLLLNLKNQNKIDQNQYSTAVLKLIINNNHLLNFDNFVLIAAAKSSSWQPSEEYSKIASLFKDDKYEIESIVTVALLFISQLWIEDIHADDRDCLITSLLDNLLLREGVKDLIIRDMNEKFRFPTIIQQYLSIMIATCEESHVTKL